MEDAEGHRVAGLGKLVDGGCQGGEVGTGSTVANIDQLVQIGGAPDFADLLQNLRWLAMVVGAQGAADAMQADLVARAFVAQA